MNYEEKLGTMKKENSLLTEKDLIEMGFNSGKMETEHHTVVVVYYDTWNIHITSKPLHGDDMVFLRGFYTVEEFKNIIKTLTKKTTVK